MNLAMEHCSEKKEEELISTISYAEQNLEPVNSHDITFLRCTQSMSASVKNVFQIGESKRTGKARKISKIIGHCRMPEIIIISFKKILKSK